MDVLLTFLTWIIVSALVAYGVIKSQLAQSLGIPTDVKPYLIVVGVLVIGRIIQNLLTIPPRLYFEARKKQDKRVWEDIYISKKEKKERSFRHYGIEINNQKAYGYSSAYILIRYLEIDNMVCVSQPQSSDKNSHKLSWIGANSNEPTRMWLKENGKAIAYLLDAQTNNTTVSYKARFYQYLEKEGKLVQKIPDVKNNLRGEFSILAYDGIESPINFPLGSPIYCFEIIIQRNKVKMKLDEGELSYKLPTEG